MHLSYWIVVPFGLSWGIAMQAVLVGETITERILGALLLFSVFAFGHQFWRADQRIQRLRRTLRKVKRHG